MPKKHRVSHSDFKLAASSRFRRARGEFFMLSSGILADDEGSDPRVACVVSKKTAARAVDRNLIKRRCRTAAIDAILEIKKPVIFIFYANRNAKDASFCEIKKDIEELIRKSLTVAS